MVLPDRVAPLAEQIRRNRAPPRKPHNNVATFGRCSEDAAQGEESETHQQIRSSAIGGILERTVLETLSSQLNGMFTGPARHKNSGADRMNAARIRLSKRQMEVLKLLGQGKTNKEIAMALFLSPNTIKLHVSAILERLNLKSRTQAALLSSTLLQDPNAETKKRAPLGNYSP